MGAAVSSVVNSKTGKTRSLDRKTQADERVPEADVQEPPKLARLLTRILGDLAALKRPFVPRRTDFEDVDVDDTGTTKYRFPHGFGDRVRWWVVDWSSVAGWPALIKDDSSDKDTLVLVSLTIGTATIRVEAVG